MRRQSLSVAVVAGLSMFHTGCGGTTEPAPQMASTSGPAPTPAPAPLLGAKLVGLWRGNIIYGTNNCSNGTSNPASSAAFNFSIAQVADGEVDFPLSVVGTTCGNVDLAVGSTGTTANQTGMLTCQPYTDSGWYVTTTFENGFVSLSSGALSFSILDASVQIDSATGTKVTCLAKITGTFTK